MMKFSLVKADKYTLRALLIDLRFKRNIISTNIIFFNKTVVANTPFSQRVRSINTDSIARMIRASKIEEKYL